MLKAPKRVQDGERPEQRKFWKVIQPLLFADGWLGRTQMWFQILTGYPKAGTKVEVFTSGLKSYSRSAFLKKIGP